MEPGAAEVFEAALDLKPAERDAFLDRACAGNQALRNKVATLLAADARAEGFLESPLRGVRALARAEPSANPLIGEHIGHYRVVGVIATGGMGTVYEAMQERPKRRVALKMIRTGLASESALRRFTHEAEILAPPATPGHRSGLRGGDVRRAGRASLLRDGVRPPARGRSRNTRRMPGSRRVRGWNCSPASATRSSTATSAA